MTCCGLCDSPCAKQFFGSVSPHFGAMSVGVTFGFSAVALPQLNAPDSTIKLTREMASWIASVFPLVVAIGCLISGCMLERFGRRFTHIVSSIFSVIGWTWIAFSESVEMILIGRIISGMGTGLGRTCYGIYVSEIASPKRRGLLLCLNNLFLGIGILYSHTIGTYMHWTWLALLSGVPAALCLLIILFFPESPVWLFNKERIEEGQEVFLWYRGDSATSRMEMMKYIQVDHPHRKSMNYTVFRDLHRPEVWKSMILVNVLFMSLQATGISAVTAYTVDVIDDTVKNVEPHACMITLDLMRIFASVIIFILVEKLQRRTLVSVGNFGCVISLLTLAYLTHIHEETSFNQMVTVGVLLAYIWFCVMIFQSTWTVTNEIYPHDMKGMESSIGATINFLGNFTCVKTFYVAVDNLTISGTYLTYAAGIGLCAVFLLIFLPETKSLTLLEIEEYFGAEAATTART